MDNLKAKWQSLSQRERLYVSVAVILVAILVVYYWLITPLNTAVDNARSQLQYQQSLLTWMQPRVQSLQQQQRGGTQTQAVSASELLPTIDQRLKAATFASNVDSVTQNNASDVRITFKEVPFDELMSWLATQWQVSRIKVSALDVTKGSKPGLVEVNLVLNSSS